VNKIIFRRGPCCALVCVPGIHPLYVFGIKVNSDGSLLLTFFTSSNNNNKNVGIVRKYGVLVEHFFVQQDIRPPFFIHYIYNDRYDDRCGDRYDDRFDGRYDNNMVTYLFVVGSMSASTNHHNKLFESILHAPYSFFDK